MAHKTLIGGTAYEISGGKTLIGGTAYSIDKGKTLVGGTVYEVSFAPAMATVYLRPTADVSLAHSVYPAGSSGYACIDEGVADGDSTYIYHSYQKVSTFTFSGTIPDGMEVTNGRVVIVGRMVDDTNASVYLTIIIGETEYMINDMTNPAKNEIKIEGNTYAEYYTADGFADDIISALNTLGTGEVSFSLKLNSLPDNKKTTYITQCFIELTCEG